MAETLRVLVVEDNPADIFLLEKALKSREVAYELDIFHDGEAAIKNLAEKNRTLPDLILIDLNLPRRDGFEVLTAIRGHPSLSGIPVAILTSSEDAKDKHRIALIGGERYIHKPPILEEFIEQVGDAIIAMLKGHAATKS
jgi:two-component system, chemotaxis family, response regulator Rcp1